MSNSNEIIALNKMLSDIKILVGSLSILDDATENKNQVTTATALDAVNFRVREIAKLSAKFGDFNFSVDSILNELSSPMPNIKKLHELMDTQLETLRKMALSEMLTHSLAQSNRFAEDL